MNKRELIKSVSDVSGLTVKQATLAIEALVSTLITSIENGERVSLHRFGTFSVVSRAERQGTNPATREKITIPPRKIVRFKSKFTIK